MTKLVIFDLDGVLINSEPLHLKAWQDLLKQHGLSFKPEWFKKWVGIQDRELGNYIISNHNLNSSIEHILQQKQKKYLELIKNTTFDSDKLKSGLKKITNLPFGLATSSSNLEVSLMLEKLNLKDVFDVIITSDDVRESKPSPACYLEAARRLKIPHQNCLVIEDSPAGIQAGKRVGMTVIAVSTNFSKPALEEADCVFDTTLQAISWIVDSR